MSLSTFLTPPTKEHLKAFSSFMSCVDDIKYFQARITRLVVTDFACWMPVCFMAFASIAGVTLSPVVYPVSAIILLPINSALNPVLYSNIFAVVHE